MFTTLITGANRGLGLQFARDYIDEGYQVIAACRAPERASALRELQLKTPDRLKTLALDVTDATSITNAAQALHSQPIDLLINNAGVMGPRAQNLGQLDYAEWAHVLAVNTFGPLRMIEAFTEHLERGTHKRIVTLTSGLGSIGDNTSGGWIAYRTSKAALNMAVKSAAIELAARKLICIVINPGWVRTDMGGASATLSPAQSTAAMRRVIAGLKARDSGKFFNHDGREYAW